MSKTFAELGLSKPIVQALSARGFTAPFPIQERVIRDVLDGHDVLVQSPTGSGKTLAFGAPMIDGLDGADRGPSALILAPTRELASQIVDECRSLTQARQVRIAAVYGGVGFGPQIRAAQRADIVVATPGRLEDLLERGALKLDRVRVLVLDEADRMLDMGFKPAVDRIVAKTPKQRQTLFFSATLEGMTGKIAASYTRDARRHTQAAPKHKEADISHRFLHVDSQGAKIDHLIDQLRAGGRDRTLVFVRTKRGVDRLVKRLRSRDIHAVAMHGGKSQGQRERALDSFERGDVDTLIATDVAARGIDVADITKVVNFDAPADRDAYVHRVGRTGRAGRRGEGTSFVLSDQAAEMRRIAHDLGLSREFEGVHQRGAHSNGQVAHSNGQGNRPRANRNRNRNRNRKVSS